MECSYSISEGLGLSHGSTSYFLLMPTPHCKTAGNREDACVSVSHVGDPDEVPSIYFSDLTLKLKAGPSKLFIS